MRPRRASRLGPKNPGWSNPPPAGHPSEATAIGLPTVQNYELAGPVNTTRTFLLAWEAEHGLSGAIAAR